MAKGSTEETDGPDELLGKLLAGRYLITALIDRGGMGKVYRAEQQPLGRGVALKTLDLLDPRGEFKERFFNEASIASRLKHPNTVRIFDYGRSDEGVYFLTMELLEGQSLHQLVKASAPLPAERVIAILRQVCGALHEAHEMGIVHRDLKPGNIYLTKHGDDPEFVKVLDFGLVKNLESDVSLSQTGQALGSPLYMSPEQVEGDRVDRRADIYSLGLVMYVALCGRVPFKKGSVATIMMQQVTGTIPTFAKIAPEVQIHPSLEWIVRRCIEKDRTQRIASMRELSTALKICQRELHGDFNEPVPWALDAAGNLALPPEFLETAEESQIRTVPLEFNDVPSSPTLNRSNVATSVAVVGGVSILGFVAVSAIVAALLLMALIGWLWWATPSAVPSDVTLPAEPIQQVQPSEPVKPAPAPDPPLEVKLSTDPSGAEVTRDGILIGNTPLPIEIERGSTQVLVLSLEGHETREVKLDGSAPDLLVKLKPKLRTGTFKAPPPSPDPAPSNAPAPSQPSPKEFNSSDLVDPWARP